MHCIQSFTEHRIFLIETKTFYSDLPLATVKSNGLTVTTMLSIIKFIIESINSKKIVSF